MELTVKERKLIYDALNTQIVEKMRVISQTRTDSFMFADPEETREKLYDDIDVLNDLIDRICIEYDYGYGV